MKYYIDTVKDTFLSYFRGQGLVILILCVLYAVSLAVIGVKFGILIGILAGLLSVIPYMGFLFGFFTSVVVAAVQFRSVTYVLYVVLAFAVIQLLESFVISPRVMGKSVGFSPLVMMVLLIVGGFAFGPLGMIIAVPVAAVFFKIYMDKIRNKPGGNNTQED